MHIITGTTLSLDLQGRKGGRWALVILSTMRVVRVSVEGCGVGDAGRNGKQNMVGWL